MYKEQKQLFNWRQVRRNKQELNLCTRILISGLLVSAATASFAGAASPVLDAVTHGSAAIATGVNQITIDQQSLRVDINWASFNTPAGYNVNFVQPSATAVAINRITGARTEFNGNLNAKGQVFLINNNGITFGRKAKVNVGSLLATTSNLKNKWSRKNLNFSAGENPAYASIINNGKITITSEGGFGALIAPYVENNGTLTSSGKAAGVESSLIAATEFWVKNLRTNGQDASPEETPLIKLKKSQPSFEGAPGPLGVNQGSSGHTRAKSGFIRLTNMIYNATVNISGELDANQFGKGRSGGTILVESKGDLNFDGAKIHAVGGDSVRGQFTARGDITSSPDSKPSRFTFKSKSNRFKFRSDGNTFKSVRYVESSTASVLFRSRSGNLTLNANVQVTAKADKANEVGKANANLTYRAEQNITLTGDTTLVASALARSRNGDNRQDIARSQIKMESSSGNLTYKGDISSTASAKSRDGDAKSQSQIAMESRFGNLTSEGDISSIARSNSPGYGDARAWSNLSLTAGKSSKGDQGDNAPNSLFTGDLDITGAVTSRANSTGKRVTPKAKAFTSLIATGSTRISGPNPLAEANSARVQGMSTAWQECDGEDCTPVTPGISRGRPQFAQLIIEGTEGTPLALDLLNGYRGPNQPSPGFGGTQGLRFSPSGDMQPATAAGLTLPPGGPVGNAEEILAAGGDPTKQLPPTAAGPGSDDDFCGQLVNGGCSGN